MSQAHRFGYASECRVCRDTDGKPSLVGTDGKPLGRYCSISHTRNWLACVFAEDAPVGVDIEVARPRDYAATGTWFFGAELGERIARAEPGSQRALFYQAWTAYEALYKCGLNKRRAMAPLLRPAVPQNVSGIALSWLYGPQDLHACIAVLRGDGSPAPAISVLGRTDGGFAADPRWRVTSPVD